MTLVKGDLLHKVTTSNELITSEQHRKFEVIDVKYGDTITVILKPID